MNPTAVGMFVVGAIAIAAAAVFILGTEGLFDTKQEFVTYFQTTAMVSTRGPTSKLEV